MIFVMAGTQIYRFGKRAWASSLSAMAPLTAMPWAWFLAILLSETRGVSPRDVALLRIGRLESATMIITGCYLLAAFVNYIALTSSGDADEIDFAVVSLAWDGICIFYIMSLVCVALLVNDNNRRRRRRRGAKPGAAPIGRPPRDVESPKDVDASHEEDEVDRPSILTVPITL